MTYSGKQFLLEVEESIYSLQDVFVKHRSDPNALKSVTVSNHTYEHLVAELEQIYIGRGSTLPPIKKLIIWGPWGSIQIKPETK